MNTAWINAPDAQDRGLVILSELVERVERLERGRNPLADFDRLPSDEEIALQNGYSVLAAEKAALQRQLDVVIEQNNRFAERIVDLQGALKESLANLEAVIAVQRGLL